MLYLFDIDATLLDTGGAGMPALHEATQEIFGAAGPELDLAGSTDLGIAEFLHEPSASRRSRNASRNFSRLIISSSTRIWPMARKPAGGFP